MNVYLYGCIAKVESIHLLINDRRHLAPWGEVKEKKKCLSKACLMSVNLSFTSLERKKESPNNKPCRLLRYIVISIQASKDRKDNSSLNVSYPFMISCHLYSMWHSLCILVYFFNCSNRKETARNNLELNRIARSSWPTSVSTCLVAFTLSLCVYVCVCVLLFSPIVLQA